MFCSVYKYLSANRQKKPRAKSLNQQHPQLILHCAWCVLWELTQFGMCLLIKMGRNFREGGISQLREKQEHIWINKDLTKLRSTGRAPKGQPRTCPECNRASGKKEGQSFQDNGDDGCVNCTFLAAWAASASIQKKVSTMCEHGEIQLKSWDCLKG